LRQQNSRKFFAKGLDMISLICPAGPFVAARRINSSCVTMQISRVAPFEKSGNGLAMRNHVGRSLLSASGL
jgi:hypothetical protein